MSTIPENGTFPPYAARRSLPTRLQRLIGRQLRERLQPKFVGIRQNRSDSDNGAYVRVVENAVRKPAVFRRFKQHPDYRRILEHATAEQGREDLQQLRRYAPDLVERIDDFKLNDEIGTPDLVEYEGIGRISPSTLKYIHTAMMVRHLFGDLSGMTAAEIGIGYGGQLLILDRLWPFRRYDMFDLPPVLALASKYLEAHILNGSYRTLTLNQFSGEEEYDFVLSEWAFSELPAHLQRVYAKKVLGRAKRALLSMNSGKLMDHPRSHNKLSLDELRELLPPFDVIDPFGPADHRYRIAWGHQS